MTIDEQDAVIRFLSDPASWDAGIDGVEIRETPLSVVFLGGKRALKLKRMARYPYLDYSTSELRRRACVDEVATNLRMAPELYRGVIAVTRREDGRLTLDGDGEPVEWLVDMTRFGDGDSLDVVVEREAFDDDLVVALADEVAAFHGRAARRPDLGGHEGLAEIIRSNRQCFRDWGEGVIAEPDVDRVFKTLETALSAVAPLLDARRNAGYVRHCHGDLHLGNVCLFGGRPVPFDAIEFNEGLANIDVLYDLAFLLMDLAFRDRVDAANRLMNRYADRTGDTEGFAALPLFMGLRAVVRSHVAAADVHRDPKAAEAPTRAALSRAYMDMAERCLRPAMPRLVAIGGLSGTGKSRIAQILAADLPPLCGARVIRSDVVRKRLVGRQFDENLSAAGYAGEMTVRTYDAVCAEARIALESGRSVIADAVFARPAERAAIEEIARDVDARFEGFWLQAPLELRLRRIAERKGDASDATAAVARCQESYDLTTMEWAAIDAVSGISHVAKSIKKCFKVDA